MRNRRLFVLPGLLAALLVVGVAASSASAVTIGSLKGTSAAQPGVQRIHLKYGPITITPGQNFIKTETRGIPQPKVDGYMVGFYPNLHYAIPGSKKLGAVPRVDVIHLHHGVWLSFGKGRKDASTGGGLPAERFAAAGEEKTRLRFPKGYGYAYRTSDHWVLNYMIHNLTDAPTKVWITYDVDFIPATAPAAKTMQNARPIWMDVQNGEIYPVYDALKGMGKNGRYTYPTQAKNPYAPGQHKNWWTVDQDGTLVATAGHLHPGGLHTDLYDTRAGKTAHLFRSDAHYFEPAGAVSWDVSMTATKPNWKVNVHKGDVMSITSTYDVSHASWYEVMGIMVVFMADGQHGTNPFTHKVDQPGTLTHGHLPENRHHGGNKTSMPSPLDLPVGGIGGTVDIAHFIYGRGSLNTQSAIPRVRRGKSLTFKNLDNDGLPAAAWHTITACKSPCNRGTGIAYPIANGNVQFDSGQLGTGGPPTSGQLTWKTPENLPVGTYTYFCRVHPFMRGAFRVIQ
jgi:plastocyanin